MTVTISKGLKWHQQDSKECLFRFTVQKEDQTTARVIILPKDMIQTPMKPLLKMWARTPHWFEIWRHVWISCSIKVGMAQPPSIRRLPATFPLGFFLEKCVNGLNLFLYAGVSRWSPLQFLVPRPKWPITVSTTPFCSYFRVKVSCKFWELGWEQAVFIGTPFSQVL